MDSPLSLTITIVPTFGRHTTNWLHFGVRTFRFLTINLSPPTKRRLPSVASLPTWARGYSATRLRAPSPADVTHGTEDRIPPVDLCLSRQAVVISGRYI